MQLDKTDRDMKGYRKQVKKYEIAAAEALTRAAAAEFLEVATLRPVFLLTLSKTP